MAFSINFSDMSGADYSKYLNKDTVKDLQASAQNINIFNNNEDSSIDVSVLNDIEVEEIDAGTVKDIIVDQYNSLTGNNETFDSETIKKHETYAHLAADTRNDEAGEEIDGFKRIDTITNDENGFAACVYQNEETGEIVVSYRCTNNKGGIESDKQLAQDEIPDQYADALKVYDEIKEKYPDSDVQIVGYSLGASLAELVASEREDAKAVTFEGYGTSEIIENNPQFKDNGNCINYTTQDSLVSGTSQHPGQTLTLKHDGGDADSVYDEVANRHYIDNFYDLENAEYANESLEDAKREIKQNGKDKVLDKYPNIIDIASDYFLGDD